MGCDIHAVFQAKRPDGYWDAIESEYDERRHYLLFAWLADVRNGYGFAGVPTHEAVTPIASARGFPEKFWVESEAYEPQYDFGPKPNGYSLSKWMGDHSHSWLTADEILAAPRPNVMRTGIVPRKFLETWDGKSSPEEFSGGISGPGISVAQSVATMRPGDTHIRIEWRMPVDELDYFINEVRRLKEKHGEVRMVFGFDS